MKIAEVKQEEIDTIDLTFEPAQAIQRVSDTSLGDALPVNWQHTLRHSSDALNRPLEFIFYSFSVCVAEEPAQNHFVIISFIELTLWFVQNLKAQFPFEKTTKGSWMYKAVDDLLLKPTLASLPAKLKQCFLYGLKTLGLNDFVCRGVVRHEAGISYPVDGLLLSMSPEIAADICAASAKFFGPRMLRKAADLAKPVA